MKIIAGADEARAGLRLLWEPRDCWVGVFWTHSPGFRHVYVCLLPCLPIVWTTLR